MSNDSRAACAKRRRFNSGGMEEHITTCGSRTEDTFTAAGLHNISTPGAEPELPALDFLSAPS